uniref:Uncharacterized protein n=1 Tax=Siphoviridae sp. ctZHD14 TaxID=2827891 RepID=A0A8S5SVV6_9CAUD|nr:MAG TPA: hypothetical protein [Siphoviridae sp. ctZHD14]
MAQVNLVNQVGVKSDTGEMGSYYNVGTSFANIVDTRINKGNYTLEQFFDSYMSFMRGATFVYSGNTTPQNPHVGIWLDTNKTNQDPDILV